MTILIIEDDADILELIEYQLRQEKLVTERAMKGSDGLRKARQLLPDLILLDLMLPDMSGLDICKSLKSEAKTKSIPIVMVTAKGEEIDRVLGFEMGVEDYITKPFSPRELGLRVKAILRRSQEKKTRLSAEGRRVCGPLQVDPEKFEVRIGGTLVHLTAIEFKLLNYLLATQGRVATRDVLLDQVWGYEAALTTRTVDAHVKRLREKLGEVADYIETIRGVGYRFKDKVQAHE